MIAHKTIYIKNIYYMLSYAFKVLNEKGYKKIEAESFENTADLLSEILIIGVTRQIKQGLVKDWKFNPMAFDNLALQQLDLKDRLSPSPFYMGDEGQFTLFIDLVTGEYAKSSTSRDRFPIANKNADQIFQHIRTGKEPQ